MSKLKVGEVGGDVGLAGKRDAFHVPGILVVSDKPVKAGDSVRFVDGSTGAVRKCLRANRDGVVDPFIPEGGALAGQPFWIFVEPSKLKDGALTHHFELVGESTPTEAVVPEPSPEVAKLQDELEKAKAKIEYWKERYENDNDDGCRGCYS